MTPVLKTNPELGPGLVIVVDDDDDIRESMGNVLEEAGYWVIRCANGVEALARMREAKRRVALVLLDLMMPVMDGWEFLEVQRADPAIAHVPVVVITASADLLRRRITSAGVLSKPVELDKLLRTVKRYTR
jgi:CheY-like chemotaxis protein